MCVLVRRQLSSAGWKLVSIPYWEWGLVKHDNVLTQRQLRCDYLATALDAATGTRTAARGDGWVVIDTSMPEQTSGLLDDGGEEDSADQASGEVGAFRDSRPPVESPTWDGMQRVQPLMSNMSAPDERASKLPAITHEQTEPRV